MSIEKFTDDTRITQEVVPFTQVNTKVVQNLYDMEAGFVWIYLLTMPRNWKIVKEHLKNHFNIGNAKIKKIFSYLHARQLIEYTRKREANGTLGRVDIRILNGSKFIQEHVHTIGSEIRPEVECTKGDASGSVQLPLAASNKINDLDKVCTTGSENHPLDYPPSGSGLLQNKQNTKEINNNKINISCASEDALSGFDSYWEINPKKKNKIRAQKIWKKKNLSKIATLICEDVINRLENDHQWKNVQFIPHPDTYLTNELWNDDITPRGPASKKGSNTSFSDFINSPTKSGATYDEHGNAINPFN